MKRSGFAAKHARRAPRQWDGDRLPSPRATVVVPALALTVEPLPKENPVRDENYRRLVAALPCINCGVIGFSQAAHGPTLGLGIKASDRELFPLCCARPGFSGCHHLFDTYRLFDRAARDAKAKEWARRTRATLADLTGQRFSRLLVESMEYGGGNAKAVCLCDCGQRKTVLAYNVRNGNTRSCGCLARESSAETGRRIGAIQGKLNATHGMSKTPTYIAWLEARKRCYSPQNERYPYYGGRGITMCDRWLESFESFFADMGERPDGLSLDRKDNDGHYEPGNCRWATQQEQVSNRRNCIYIALDGVRVTCAEAARRLGIGETTVKRRLALGLLTKWAA